MSYNFTSFVRYLFPLDDLSRKLGTNLDEIPISRPRNQSQQQQTNASMMTPSRAVQASAATHGHKQLLGDIASGSTKDSACKVSREKALASASKSSVTSASAGKRKAVEHCETERRRDVAKKAKEEKAWNMWLNIILHLLKR